jgi:hypothetical protein
MSSSFSHDQLVRELGRQHDRIAQLEAVIERLTMLLDEHDDEITSIQLALRDTGPSTN